MPNCVKPSVFFIQKRRVANRLGIMQIKHQISPPVFYPSLIIILFTSLYAALLPEQAGAYFNNIQTWLNHKVSWLYILAVAIYLIFITCVMLSRLGDIKLGPDHSEPEYSNLSWFSMLFAAGMGIGLLFFGVAEPVMHYLSPPLGDGATIASTKEAMRITFFHWGLHGWGIYALVGLALAYFSYRHKLPLLPRAAIYPLIGDKIHGPIGHAVDIFAVVGTIFGISTSLGLGAQQLNAGLHYLFGIPNSFLVQLCLIIAIILLSTASVLIGLDKGIKRLSNFNMLMCVALLALILLLGPTEYLLRSYVQNIGHYMSELVNSTFNLYAYEKKGSWIGGWTMLYWGWWVSWAPFVGMFIARVSKGRTIREFIVGVLFIPSGFTFLWMTVFGNTAIHHIAGNKTHQLAMAVSDNVSTALFVFLEAFPATSILSFIAVILVAIFFITSADSGALVVNTLASGGKEETPFGQKVLWTSTIGLIASSLLYAGGLHALQTLTIASAFPFLFVLLAICYSLYKALVHDWMLQKSVQNHNTSVQFSSANIHWKKRLDALISHPGHNQTQGFLKLVVVPALNQLAEQLASSDFSVKVKEDEEMVRLVVYKEEAENFIYGVRVRQFAMPTYAEDSSHEDYCRAEVFLLQGGQQYDVFGYTQEQIIVDAISQYERHLHFLYLASSEILEES